MRLALGDATHLRQRAPEAASGHSLELAGHLVRYPPLPSFKVTLRSPLGLFRSRRTLDTHQARQVSSISHLCRKAGERPQVCDKQTGMYSA